MKMARLNGKRAAMEMSVGTIVTIVLLMTVLILGLVMIRTIFKTSTENINILDTAIKSEISKTFAQDSSKRVVVYPPSRKITIKKGEDSLGFGLSIRNVVGDEEDRFTYEVSAVESSCRYYEDFSKADNLITLGRTREAPGILLGPGSFMEDDPVFVRFAIPDDAPPCEIRYSIEVSNSEGSYATSDLDLIIKSA